MSVGASEERVGGQGGARSDAPSLKPYLKPYRDAVWGLRNHWYPALFSTELAEGETKSATIAGEPIVLHRWQGTAYALRDRCVHRGVKLSARPTCLKPGTITCWYHGFTFDLRDGKLLTIVAAPDDELIGKANLHHFPVEEVNGLIFVFVGDADYRPVPPLAEDLPRPSLPGSPFPVAHPQGAHTVMRGIHRRCVGNWRLATESGGDPGHVLIHRNSALLLAFDYAFALGERPKSTKSIRYFEDEGPKGVLKFVESEMDLVLENKELSLRARGSKPTPGLQVGLYLPCVLMVENWPQQGLVQYEWYVPIDDRHHEYWQIIAKDCRTDAEREEFDLRYRHMWEELALRGFNDDDIFAREAMANFYEDGPGWDDETLFSLDSFIVAWRRIAARYNRGIQTGRP